ncbi:uncharacterized protein L969DRAFT_373044 [Mixia osmundae IAM 14324]|uniref:DNL-type domain-containing protein n=1 Tax=Mixia osmundae (strain CBS 9802 / IAM 14324 / JCM 22182 / KY 12970) TaxID=764103 RepID=G7DUD3_MIXOS|nr:uncharacterized protein L969DRAFT_373044 [Mixia osmundae IAM 14324]KEI41065.1 hypothetical protein L969DRAFT_373044 [Mixia osmundae IAM 14324]GAA94193.1 hypothetical protein E5Q_00841 [Mixia osmundae IAM 14324]
MATRRWQLGLGKTLWTRFCSTPSVAPLGRQTAYGDSSRLSNSTSLYNLTSPRESLPIIKGQPTDRRRQFASACTCRQSSSPRQSDESGPKGQTLGKVEPKLQITFTCTAPACTTRHRSTHQFSKRSYETGIVLIECPECHTRHLIADHLGWFSSEDLTNNGQTRTIEEILKAKGQTVTRGSVPEAGDIEILPGSTVEEAQ